MKTVKFRGKSEKTGEWLYGSLINNAFFDAESKAPVLYVIDTDKMDYDCFEDFAEQMDDYKVDRADQYTGLQDKNSAEVYEGDIVLKKLLFQDNLYQGVVQKIQGCYCIYSEARKQKTYLCRPDQDGNILEVIGNIHENPELLEVEA